MISIVLASTAFGGMAPCARPAVRSIAGPRMAFDLSKQLGFDVETGGPWDPLGYASKAGACCAPACAAPCVRTGLVSHLDPPSPARPADYDFTYCRALELKHGRVAMLATLGFVVPELIGTWPSELGLFDASNPITAWGSVPALGILQILAVIYLIEKQTGTGAENGRIPGDIGFDPLNLSRDGIDERLALAELKNGRLAMIASIAFIVQSALTGKGVIAGSFDVLA
jgi:hypothetical protein